MRRRVGLLSLWVVAVVASVTVASQAVGTVREQITDRPSELVSAASQATGATDLPGEVDASGLPADSWGDAAPATSTSGASRPVLPEETPFGSTSSPPSSGTASTVTSRPSTTAGTDTTTITSPVSATAPTTQSSSPATSSASTTSSPPEPSPTTTGSSTSTSTSTSTTTSTTPASTTTTSPSPKFSTQTFQLVGGWVTIRYGGNEVHYQAGAPRPGFAIEVENTGPGEVEVEFESDGHESRFEAEMENGELNPVITEKSS